MSASGTQRGMRGSPTGVLNFFGASGSNIGGDHMIKRRAFLAGGLGAVAIGVQAIGAANAASNSPSGAFAELPGVKLWFTDSGGAGVPLILLHANTGTSAVWANQV